MTEILSVKSQRLTFKSQRQQHNCALNKSEIFLDRNKKADERDHDHNLWWLKYQVFRAASHADNKAWKYDIFDLTEFRCDRFKKVADAVSLLTVRFFSLYFFAIRIRGPSKIVQSLSRLFHVLEKVDAETSAESNWIFTLQVFDAMLIFWGEVSSFLM
jgi:hypothetical protein